MVDFCRPGHILRYVNCFFQLKINDKQLMLSVLVINIAIQVKLTRHAVVARLARQKGKDMKEILWLRFQKSQI